MRYACQTLFDITPTGVTGHFRSTRVPFVDNVGNSIIDQATWNRSRNQQRNWETLTQILSLRTQLFDITKPVRDTSGTSWMFEFETEQEGVFGDDIDPVCVLRNDAAGVPMLLDLDNRSDIVPVLCTEGPQQNIWFAPVSINT